MKVLKTLDSRRDNLDDPQILTASMTNKDTIHYHGHVIQAPDATKFIQAIEKEVNGLNNSGIWKV